MRHFFNEARIDRYFDRGLHARAEGAMRGHLERCPACRRRYEINLAAEAALPDGAKCAEERLWQGIARMAHAPHAKVAPARTPRLVLAAGLGAATLLMLVWFRPDSSPVSTRTLVERGGRIQDAAVHGPVLQVFRRGAEGVAEPVGDTIQAGDALMFAYSNPGRRHRSLMVFAVDERYRVFWYYPAFERGGDDPAAVAIDENRLGVELGHAIRQPLSQGVLRLYALFLEQSASVSTVEAAVAESLARPRVPLTSAPALPVPGALQASWLLQVAP